MEPDSTSADQHHASHGCDKRLVEVINDDCSNATERRIHAPQRPSQEALRLLYDRMPKMHIDEVSSALRSVCIERNRAQRAVMRTPLIARRLLM